MTTAIAPFGMPAGIDPRVWRRSVAARLDELLDAAMNLITALDLMETDPDLEPDDEGEPGTWQEYAMSRGHGEDDDENLEECVDAEPWLAGFSGNSDDRESDGMGQATVDDEPSLGWTNAANQEFATLPSAVPWSVDDGEATTCFDDREFDDGESGIGDADGLQGLMP